MRSYRIDIDGTTAYTSHPNGNFAPPDPGALQVEFDLITTTGSTPFGSSQLRIYGIGLDVIQQAHTLNEKQIQVYGGMGVGLPLATIQAQEAGLLATGMIWPAYGNWIGPDQYLDIIIIPDGSAAPASAMPGYPNNKDNPANLVHQLAPQQKLGDAIQQTLQTAFPDKTVNINISDSLVLNYKDTGFYQNLNQYAAYIKDISAAIVNAGKAFAAGNYLGVQIAFSGDTINVFDGTKPPSNNTTIGFYDLLGQPVWLGIQQIQVKTVLRGDIQVGDHITLPQTLTTQTEAAAKNTSDLRNSSSLQGTFSVQAVRHVGNFRQPDGMSWNSTFDCVPDNSNGL